VVKLGCTVPWNDEVDIKQKENVKKERKRKKSEVEGRDGRSRNQEVLNHDMQPVLDGACEAARIHCKCAVGPWPAGWQVAVIRTRHVCWANVQHQCKAMTGLPKG